MTAAEYFLKLVFPDHVEIPNWVLIWKDFFRVLLTIQYMELFAIVLQIEQFDFMLIMKVQSWGDLNFMKVIDIQKVES